MTDVQAPEAQGGSEGGIFDSYLQAVPEEGRETVTSYLKDAEKHVNGRLETAADLEKRFGNYKDIDFSSYEPAQLNDLIAWHQQMMSSPQAYQDWLKQSYQEAGLDQAIEESEQESETLTNEQIQNLIDERVQAELGPQQERLAEWEELRVIDTIEDQIREDFARIESESGKQLTKDQQAMIIDLGLNHEGEDWVQHGFDRLKEIHTAGERAFVENAATRNEPSPISTGGQEAFKPTTDWKEAQVQAKEILERMTH